MLQLIDIKKTYKVGDIQTKALAGISVAFREKEFVAILGPSGSGKTTCLNIIGGLDRYDSGEMIIKGKNTKHFSNSDWDAYRNNSIGFVFQNYHLIPHLSIVANVELSLTLSGVPASERRRRALQVLEQVGLKDHLHKKPNQLSGGQAQRVAIARALVNDPEILLCDEPTGALDSGTSVQIMDLIKEISKDRLVIMVTHNADLANQYADRIIQFHDGKIVSDSNPYEAQPEEKGFKLKKTSMSFFTALRLSLANLRTKKGRTFLTSLASSIGIIGIAVILSLSSGFQKQIDQFQSDTMAEFPIIIAQTTMEIDPERLQTIANEEKKGRFPDTKQVVAYEPDIQHKNILTDEYLDYIKKIDPAICSSVGYTRLVNMNLLRQVGDKVVPVSITSGLSGMANSRSLGTANGVSNMGVSSYPIQLNPSKGSYLERNYDVLAGKYPANKYELVLVVDSRNRVGTATLKALGFEVENGETIPFEEIIGTQFKLVDNNDYYVKTEAGAFLPVVNLPGADLQAVYESDNNITLTISGIVRQNPDTNIAILAPGLAYSDELSEEVIERAMKSEIVEAQKQADHNVMTMKDFANDEEKEQLLAYLGGNAAPFMIMLHPDTFEAKNELTAYLDKYNEGRPREEKVIYNDLASTIVDLTGKIIDGITVVLIAFAAISLVVSLIMIGIITYTSVLERTKEIGILRALGARKKDITRVFDAETCILGVFSGVLGIVIALLAIVPINAIIENAASLKNVAQLQPRHAIMLIIISTILTMLGGHLPARMASKKDAVEALRSE